MSLKDVSGLTRAIAAAVALFLLGGLIPVVGAPLMLCAPAPLLIHVLGNPRPYRSMTTALALTLVVIGLAAGPVEVLAFALSLGLLTVVITVMVRQRWSFERIIFCGTAAMLAAGTTALLLWAGSPAVLIRQLQNFVGAAMNHSAGLYEKLGMSQAESRQVTERVLAITALLAPALGAILGALTVLVNLGLMARWLDKEKLGYQLLSPLVTWRTPEWLVWLLLATGFGMFIPLEAARIAATNGFVLIAAIYFCQGLAIMAYYLQMLAMPRIVRGTIYVIALLQPVLAALVCLAGVFDLWIDFRRLKPPSPEAGSLDDFF